MNDGCGSFREPTYMGGGGTGTNNAGGAAIKVTAVTSVAVAGSIDVSAYSAYISSAYGATGGSIWITAASLTGTGVLRANGYVYIPCEVLL